MVHVAKAGPERKIADAVACEFRICQKPSCFQQSLLGEGWVNVVPSFSKSLWM